MAPSSTASVVWARLEPPAIQFLKSNAAAILSNPLWQTLANFLGALDAMVAAWASEGSGHDLVGVFQEAQVEDAATRDGYRLDLGDLFLALVIVRRGGPANLDGLIRKGELWDLAELLGSKPSLLEVADAIRALDLLAAGAGQLTPPSGASPAEAQAALAQRVADAKKTTVLFPHALFAPLAKPVHGVGFREFHVVKQHIRRYELAEITRIENILHGESRSHTLKHSLSNERDSLISTTNTTENDKELSSADHVDVKNEAENQVKEDTKVDAGVHASYDGGSYKLSADLNVSYAKSTESAKKYASDVAKDVTQKAASKVSQTVVQSQTTKIIEAFEENEHLSFDNKGKAENVSGLYQWVEKVYLAQTFSLGPHLLLDLMVPEPAANLLALATSAPPDSQAPVPPAPLKWVSFPGTTQPSRPLELDDDVRKLITDQNAVIHDLQPADLDPDEVDGPPTASTGIPYGRWIGRYAVTGITPSPNRFQSVGKAISRDNTDGDLAVEDELTLPDGYEATSTHVQVGWKHAKEDDEIGVVTVKLAGTIAAIATENAPNTGVPAVQGKQPSKNTGAQTQNSYFIDHSVFKDLTADTVDPITGNPSPIVGSVPIAISAPNIAQVSVSLEVHCRRLHSWLTQWQIQAYEKIVAAYQQIQSNYDSKVAAMQFQAPTVGPLGAADPEGNRAIERIELKRACIGIIDDDMSTVRGTTPVVKIYPETATDLDQPMLPEPDVSASQATGARVRWFEQAFEWENIAYVFYPYYWGRRSRWVERLNLKNDDPLFLNFLQSGYARVVVPVRLGFEWAVNFYLLTGLPWLGGDLPPVGDRAQNPLYLDIAEEIKALTGGGESGESETSIGDPWEYTLPTTLIKLAADDTLPAWHRVGPDHVEGPSYPSDAPDGAWSWKDGPPKATP